MGWSIGYDSHWGRDIGYGVPAWCDHPRCWEKIDRGLSYVCGGEPYGGDNGCGLYFCGKHRKNVRCGDLVCTKCRNYLAPWRAKPDHPEWLRWKLRDASWHRWRSENPDDVVAIRAQIMLCRTSGVPEVLAAERATRGLAARREGVA